MDDHLINWTHFNSVLQKDFNMTSEEPKHAPCPCGICNKIPDASQIAVQDKSVPNLPSESVTSSLPAPEPISKQTPHDMKQEYNAITDELDQLDCQTYRVRAKALYYHVQKVTKGSWPLLLFMYPLLGGIVSVLLALTLGFYSHTFQSIEAELQVISDKKTVLLARRLTIMVARQKISDKHNSKCTCSEFMMILAMAFVGVGTAIHAIHAVTRAAGYRDCR